MQKLKNLSSLDIRRNTFNDALVYPVLSGGILQSKLLKGKKEPIILRQIDNPSPYKETND